MFQVILKNKNQKKQACFVFFLRFYGYTDLNYLIYNIFASSILAFFYLCEQKTRHKIYLNDQEKS